MKKTGQLKRRAKRIRRTRMLRNPDTRRFPRLEAQWDVTVETPGRRAQKGRLSGLNPFGAKLHPRSKQSVPAEGATLQIHLAPPDGEPPMAIKGLVWRKDRDGLAIVFVNLSSSDFVRLKKLVAPAPSATP